MKRKYLNTLLAGCLLVSIAIPAWAIPVTNLISLDSDITVGESFEVQVWVNDDIIGVDKVLTSFGFDVDPSDSLSLITYDDYTMGPQFLDDDILPNDVNGFAFPAVGDDDILLATLSFTAGPMAGLETLTVQGLFDGMFEGLYYLGLPDLTELNFNIDASLDLVIGEAVASVPEPSTVVMMGLGLVGTALIRKKARK